MRRVPLALLVLLAVLALAGCPSSDHPSGMNRGGDLGPAPDAAADEDLAPAGDGTLPGADTVDPGQDVLVSSIDLPQEFLEQVVEWTPCVLHDWDDSGAAECAEITVPFHWDDLESDTFTVHVKRLVHQGSERQLFMLQGGPGSPGTSTLSYAMERIFDADPGMDVYTIDHRGTGQSHEMSCPAEESPTSLGGEQIQGEEWEACALYLDTEWGPLDAFTVSAAARDAALLIALAGEAGKAPLVYGLSYGTFWAQRYAVLFPDQAEAVVLDSLIPPGGYQVDTKDQEENEVTHAIFDLCAADALCASKLGDDPWGLANDLFQAYRAGQACEGLLNKSIYPATLQNFIHSLGLSLWYGRAMIPAIFYRLERCTDQDVVAIYNAMVAFYGADESYWRQEMSDTLGRHLFLSELVYEPPGGGMGLEEILEVEAGLLSTRYLNYYNTAQLAFWPVYELDDAFGSWAPPELPVLVLQGDLDYLTPLVNVADAAEQLGGAHQHVVVLPGVRHGAMFESPMDEAFETHCGFDIVMAWLQDPTAAPDASCAADILPIDFSGNADLVAATLKTADLWENEALAVGCGMPDDFLVPFADDHAAIEVIGEIGTVDGGLTLANADYDVMVSGEALPVDDGTVYVADYFSYGNHYILVQAAGNFDYYTSYHYRYTFMRVTFPTIMLTNARESGEYLLPFSGELGNASLTISDIENKQFGEYGGEDYQLFYRMCPLAVADPEAAANAFWLCNDDNQAFNAGESIRLAGNVALSTDPELLKEQFQMTGACSCWKDEGVPFPCTDFDAL